MLTHKDIIVEIFLNFSPVDKIIELDEHNMVKDFKKQPFSQVELSLLNKIFTHAPYTRINGRLQTFNELKISNSLKEKICELMIKYAS